MNKVKRMTYLTCAITLSIMAIAGVLLFINAQNIMSILL